MLTSFYIQCRSPSQLHGSFDQIGQEGSSLGCSKWLRLLLEVHLGCLKAQDMLLDVYDVLSSSVHLDMFIMFEKIGTFGHQNSAWIQVKPSSCRVFFWFKLPVESCWILRKQAPHDLPHSRTLFYGKCSIYIWHPMAIYGREPSFCMLLHGKLLLPKAVNWFSWCSDYSCYQQSRSNSPGVAQSHASDRASVYGLGESNHHSLRKYLEHTQMGMGQNLLLPYLRE